MAQLKSNPMNIHLKNNASTLLITLLVILILLTSCGKSGGEDNGSGGDGGGGRTVAPGKGVAIIAIEKAKTSLSFLSIRKHNISPNFVIYDLDLPTSSGEASISWASSNPQIISPLGKVTGSTDGAGNVSVTLTATISVGQYSDSKQLVVTALEKDPSFRTATGPGGNDKTKVYEYGTAGRGLLPVKIVDSECAFESPSNLSNLKTVNLKHQGGGVRFFPSLVAGMILRGLTEPILRSMMRIILGGPSI